MPVLAPRPTEYPQSKSHQMGEAITPADWSDHQLLRRVLRHDEKAWSELVRRYKSLTYRCITKVIGKYGPCLTSADLDEIYAEVLISLRRDDTRKLRLYDAGRGT